MKNVGIALGAMALGLVAGCAGSTAEGAEGASTNSAVSAPSKTAEQMIVEAYAAHQDSPLLMRGAIFYPAKLDVGALGARFATIRETDNGGYTISFDTQAGCNSLDCTVLQLSAEPAESAYFTADTTLSGGIPASYDEGCGAHGCDKTISWKYRGIPTGFTTELGGQAGGAAPDFVYSVRAVSANLDRAKLFDFANTAIATGGRSINDVLFTNAQAKATGFWPSAPLLYPPSVAGNGLYMSLEGYDDGGYLMSLTQTPTCEGMDCLDFEISASKSSLPLDANDKLLSGTPANLDQGCGAHGCDMTVSWDANGFRYAIRYIIHDPNAQTPSGGFFLAMASAAEIMGARRPTP